MKRILIAIAATLLSLQIFAQIQNVGIGTSAPDSSAMLHVESTDKGMLIPRMTTAERNAITVPATGLLVYDTETGSFWYYEDNVWNEIAIPRLQTDSGTDDTTISIPDNDPTGIISTITLSDPGTISASTQFEVCLDITHPFAADLDITLESPNGTVIDLSSDNGAFGINYTGTCFTTAAANSIIGGSAPFTGNWLPEQPFSTFIGENIAGGWKLKVIDDADIDEGQLNNWSISISKISGPNMLADGDGDTRVMVEALPDEDMIRMFAGGDTRMVITSNGNVGIGTDDPDVPLHLEAPNPRFQFVDKDHPSDETTAASIISAYGSDGVSGSATGRLWYLGSNSFSSFDAIFGNQTPTGKLLFATAGTPKMAINPNGNVGIGTSTPSWNLDIVGESLDNGSVFQMSNSDKSQFIRMFSGRLNDTEPFLSWKSGSPFKFLSANNDFMQAFEWMRIGASGNVGIGTTTPVNKLDVEGGIAIGAAYSGTNTAPANGAIIQGNVGIGTNNPTKAILEVQGVGSPILLDVGYLFDSNSPIGQEAPVFGPLTAYFSNGIAAFGLTAFSDERIKNIVGQSEQKEDLKTLMDIEITNYQMIDTIGNGSRLHKKVIAQQVAKVYPQAVNNTLTDVIPDIYQRAEVKDNWIMLETTLLPGDRVKIITANQGKVHEVIAAEKERFQVAHLPDNCMRIFVFGREVHDLHTVDYDAISMLNVSATQEQQSLIQKQQLQIEKMQTEMDDLRQRFEKLAVFVANEMHQNPVASKEVK